ncbi:MAG TPA: type II toxin-antitoxin system VapC family toxin [Rhodospirillaceae bacterium]|nr:type II toxin-antitoxin system VapC family toxin [Rhodospirillaceae bacterium]
MLAIDTNLIVRYLTGDHPEQAAVAKELIDSEDVYVCITVFLETEWELRSVYGFAAKQLAAALRAFAGLQHVTIEDAGQIAQALDWMEAGMDFADALHLTKAQGCDAFVSFDQRFARTANRLGATKVRAL